MAAAFSNQPNVNGVSERNVIPAMVQSKVKVRNILSQPRDIWEIVDTTQITAAKQTRLVTHSSKRKGIERYMELQL